MCERPLTCGKEYMAPSVKLQVTSSSSLKPSVTMCARRLRLASSASRSCRGGRQAGRQQKKAGNRKSQQTTTQRPPYRAWRVSVLLMILGQKNSSCLAAAARAAGPVKSCKSRPHTGAPGGWGGDGLLLSALVFFFVVTPACAAHRMTPQAWVGSPGSSWQPAQHIAAQHSAAQHDTLLNQHVSPETAASTPLGCRTTHNHTCWWVCWGGCTTAIRCHFADSRSVHTVHMSASKPYQHYKKGFSLLSPTPPSPPVASAPVPLRLVTG